MCASVFFFNDSNALQMSCTCRFYNTLMEWIGVYKLVLIDDEALQCSDLHITDLYYHTSFDLHAQHACIPYYSIIQL